MHRTLRAIPLIVLAVILGASAGFAQSSSAGSAATEPSHTTVQGDRDHDQRKQRQNRTGEASTITRQELESMMRADIGAVRGTGLARGADLGRGVGLEQSAFERNVALEGGAIQLTDLPTDSRRPQESVAGRRIYYIIGGTLVAGGLVAGILILSGDDGGRPGIPRPPGRPAQ